MEKLLKVFLSQQSVVSDEAGQMQCVSRRLIDCGVSLQFFTDHFHILIFTLEITHRKTTTIKKKTDGSLST